MNNIKILNDLYSEFNKKTDVLGEPLDKGIIKTVVLLNALGIPTSQSCEGHLNWGASAPWVDVKVSETKEINSIKEHLKILWQELNDTGKSREEIEKIQKEYHLAQYNFQKPTKLVTKKLLDILDEYYSTRTNILNSVKLIVSFLGNSIRLESQGAQIQDVLDPESKKNNLILFQEEMKMFTDFLEAKYTG